MDYVFRTGITEPDNCSISTHVHSATLCLCTDWYPVLLLILAQCWVAPCHLRPLPILSISFQPSADTKHIHTQRATELYHSLKLGKQFHLCFAFNLICSSSAFHGPDGSLFRLHSHVLIGSLSLHIILIHTEERILGDWYHPSVNAYHPFSFVVSCYTIYQINIR
jgi:hypothetical protein